MQWINENEITLIVSTNLFDRTEINKTDSYLNICISNINWSDIIIYSLLVFYL